jgi:hypothetical protein
MSNETPPVTTWVKPARNGNQWLHHCRQIGKERDMHTICTYGYAGTDPATLKALADELDACVVDIRYRLWSRDPRWQPNALSAVFGTGYRPVQALGNVNYKHGGPITLASPAVGLTQIRELLHHRSVILLCACRDVETCHRTVAAAYLSEQLRVPVVYLDAKESTGRAPARQGFWTETPKGRTVHVGGDPNMLEEMRVMLGTMFDLAYEQFSKES